MRAAVMQDQDRDKSREKPFARFEYFVSLVQKRLVGWIKGYGLNHADAEDIAQEAFIGFVDVVDADPKILADYVLGDSKIPPAKNRATAVLWGIALHKIHDFYRKSAFGIKPTRNTPVQIIMAERRQSRGSEVLSTNSWAS